MGGGDQYRIGGSVLVAFPGSITRPLLASFARHEPYQAGIGGFKVTLSDNGRFLRAKIGEAGGLKERGPSKPRRALKGTMAAPRRSLFR
jgi:hypothetical protein